MLIHLSRFHGSVVLHFGARSSVAAETKNNKNIKKSWTHDNSRQWSRETNKNTTETMLLTKHKENRWPCGMIHNPTRFRFSPKTKTARRGEKKSKSTLILNEFLFSERTTKREQLKINDFMSFRLRFAKLSQFLLTFRQNSPHPRVGLRHESPNLV